MIPPEKLTEVERKCREAIAAREAEGERVLPFNCDESSIDDPCVLECIAGCRTPSRDRMAAKRLEIDVEQALRIEAGFEDWIRFAEPEPDLFALGQTLRAEQMRKNGGE